MKIILTALAILGLINPLFATGIERVVRETDPKVVKIGMVGKDGSGSCSGAFITPTGVVLTCAHCFTHEGFTKIFVKTNDGKVYRAVPLKIDQKNDLALLVTPNFGPFPYFELGHEPIRGQQVLSFGSPLGLQHTISVGWVENILAEENRLIFHSAFINPGNSGGPLVDMTGRLIGVNEAMVVSGFMQLAHGLYIAINIETVKEFIKGVK